jgi:putative NADPH-quinone reductase
MQIMVILAHPARQSFNHAIAKVVVTELKQHGHQVFYHDLYAEAFDPILHAAEIPQNATVCREVETHCREISGADGIIVVHPNWWGQPPAILKGWVDRVIRPGIAYRFADGDNGEGVPIGLLKARVACVFNTSNTAFQREASVFGDPLETIWKNCIFGLCGVKDFYRRTFGVVITSTVEQRHAWLSEVQAIVQRYFPGETKSPRLVRSYPVESPHAI